MPPPPVNNLLSAIPEKLPDELFETLVATPGLRIERIVSRGHATPPGQWYDQRTREWVMLISGRARLRFDGDDAPVEMTSGDYVDIPAGCRHRVEWTDPDQPTVWLAIHYAAEGHARGGA